MSTNKQALRKLAVDAKELAINNRYTKGVEAQKKFIAAANPATVLALLDELEAADELNKHLELAIRKAEGCSEALRRKAEAAEKRIAELEARSVTLPPTFWYEHDDLSRDIPVLDKRLVKKALRAAGITVKGE